MDFQVLLTQAALNDLEEIVACVSQDSPRAAQRLSSDLVNRAESLSVMPRRGQVLRARPQVRRLIRHSDLIIYRIDETAGIIHVLRFWHRARDQKSLQFE